MATLQSILMGTVEETAISGAKGEQAGSEQDRSESRQPIRRVLGLGSLLGWV